MLKEYCKCRHDRSRKHSNTCKRHRYIGNLAVCNADRFQNKVWLDSALDYNNSSKFANIKEAIPGIHAFAGIDYLLSFHGEDGLTPKKSLMFLKIVGR